MDSPVIAEEVDALLKRLEVGLPSDALGLLRLPLPFSRGEYLELHASGIRSDEEILKAPDKVLLEILGADRLSEIEKWRVRTELGKK